MLASRHRGAQEFPAIGTWVLPGRKVCPGYRAYRPALSLRPGGGVGKSGRVEVSEAASRDADGDTCSNHFPGRLGLLGLARSENTQDPNALPTVARYVLRCPIVLPLFVTRVVNVFVPSSERRPTGATRLKKKDGERRAQIKEK